MSHPTEAESKVIRWFFGPLLVLALLFILWSWYSRSSECVATCKAKGNQSGELKLNTGSRINIGSYCECVK